eukprot:gnl/Dysnectes_brevis/3545_a4504_802.p1 GENE.gnl/Dysnectes_brevis/3545_a4504_802~~gnl/Dysnectes_brevis/3545_a4504_802.p1  ORF type:complete len:875 (-),score=202.00 gnl/Dysnectes_brevis/3545_a4504_802:234-2858(-)
MISQICIPSRPTLESNMDPDDLLQCQIRAEESGLLEQIRSLKSLLLQSNILSDESESKTKTHQQSKTSSVSKDAGDATAVSTPWFPDNIGLITSSDIPIFNTQTQPTQTQKPLFRPFDDPNSFSITNYIASTESLGMRDIYMPFNIKDLHAHIPLHTLIFGPPKTRHRPNQSTPSTSVLSFSVRALSIKDKRSLPLSPSQTASGHQAHSKASKAKKGRKPAHTEVPIREEAKEPREEPVKAAPIPKEVKPIKKSHARDHRNAQAHLLLTRATASIQHTRSAGGSYSRSRLSSLLALGATGPMAGDIRPGMLQGKLAGLDAQLFGGEPEDSGESTLKPRRFRPGGYHTAPSYSIPPDQDEITFGPIRKTTLTHAARRVWGALGTDKMVRSFPGARHHLNMRQKGYSIQQSTFNTALRALGAGADEDTGQTRARQSNVSLGDTGPSISKLLDTLRHMADVPTLEGFKGVDGEAYQESLSRYPTLIHVLYALLDAQPSKEVLLHNILRWFRSRPGARAMIPAPMTGYEGILTALNLMCSPPPKLAVVHSMVPSRVVDAMPKSPAPHTAAEPLERSAPTVIGASVPYVTPPASQPPATKPAAKEIPTDDPKPTANSLQSVLDADALVRLEMSHSAASPLNAGLLLSNTQVVTSWRPTAAVRHPPLVPDSTANLGGYVYMLGRSVKASGITSVVMDPINPHLFTGSDSMDIVRDTEVKSKPEPVVDLHDSPVHTSGITRPLAEISAPKIAVYRLMPHPPPPYPALGATLSSLGNHLGVMFSASASPSLIREHTLPKGEAPAVVLDRLHASFASDSRFRQLTACKSSRSNRSVTRTTGSALTQYRAQELMRYSMLYGRIFPFVVAGVRSISPPIKKPSRC